MRQPIHTICDTEVLIISNALHWIFQCIDIELFYTISNTLTSAKADYIIVMYDLFQEHFHIVQFRLFNFHIYNQSWIFFSIFMFIFTMSVETFAFIVLALMFVFMKTWPFLLLKVVQSCRTALHFFFLLHNSKCF